MSNGATLDWTMMCPGVLLPQPGNQNVAEYRLFIESAPFWLPNWLLMPYVPRIAASLVLLPQMSRFKVSFEEVAAAMVADLEAGSLLSKKRVGLVKLRK